LTLKPQLTVPIGFAMPNEQEVGHTRRSSRCFFGHQTCVDTGGDQITTITLSPE
jgi:hypothetical protein